MVCNGLPRLLDLENWAVGVPSLHRPLYTKLHRLQVTGSTKYVALQMCLLVHLIYCFVELFVKHRICVVISGLSTVPEFACQMYS